jgi:hypothetical protein
MTSLPSQARFALHNGVSEACPATSDALHASGDHGLNTEPQPRAHVSRDMRPRLPDACLMQLAPHTAWPEAHHHEE